MSLRLQINLLLTLIISLLAAALLWQQVRTTRISVGEEIEASARVSTTILQRVADDYRMLGTAGMHEFLKDLGRVRANDVYLFDAQGQEIYRSPASDYKSGREAPAWFARQVAPQPESRILSLDDGRLEIRPDASRAILDGWEDFQALLAIIGIGFVALNLIAFWMVGRAVAPLTQVVAALRSVQAGNLQTRLPLLRGREANALGTTFNAMVDSVSENIRVREQAAQAKAELAQNRELTREMHERIEHDHKALAHELHDELGQHVTAIKSMGVSMSRRIADRDPALAQAARLIVESADRIHAAVRSMLTRLRPVSLDQFGLADALTDLVSDWRIQHPEKQFVLRIGPGLDKIPARVATAAFRIGQESVTNAVRHSGAKQIHINLRLLDSMLVLQVEDNGIGLGAGLPPANAPDTGFGLSGMRERAGALGGQLEIGESRAGGLLVRARLPIGDEGQNRQEAQDMADTRPISAAGQ